MLGKTDFEPRGMPPSAMLLVRRLPDPLPRCLMSDANALRSSPEWERAALLSLEDLYRRAVRPAREFVPAGAASVLFLDQGEMLACLALDLVNGDAGVRWWWTAVLRGLPGGAVEALLAVLRRKPRYIPAALHHLAQRRQAVRVVKAFSSAEAWSLLADVAREFELRLPMSVPPLEFVPVPVTEDSSTQSREQHHDAEPSALESVREIVPPWVPVIAIDAVPDSLGRERAALLGVTLLLQRFPHVPRSTAFARGFARWYEAVAHSQEKSPAIAGRDALSRVAIGTETPSSPSLAAGETAGSPQFLADATAPETTECPAKAGLSTEQPRRPESASRQSTMQILASVRTEQTQTTQENLPSHNLGECPRTLIEDVNHSRDSIPPMRTERAALLPTVAHEASSVFEERPQSARATAPKEAQTVAESLAAHLAQDQIETELGGLFFLINLVRALALHSFLEQLGLDEQLSDWAIVELLARCLIGRRDAHFAVDPIWRALAALDGRDPAVAAGHNFRGCERYALPPEWTAFLAGSESSGLGLRLRDGHLQIWHEQGFLLLDAIFDREITPDTIQRQLSACCEDYELMTRAALRGVLRKTRLAGCDPLGITPGRELRRFFAFLLPYIRWRLASNLGVSSAGSSAIADVLLLRSAHAYITSTHIDVVMSMNQASGPVRLAGLDTDPGWVPSFGRVVKFHFI
jgi:hypothetical protein